jgi:hypothetical protein
MSSLVINVRNPSQISLVKWEIFGKIVVLCNQIIRSQNPSGRQSLYCFYLSLSLPGDSSFSFFHASINPTANGTGTVCDQKTPKFFVSPWEEFIAGYMGVKGVY